MEKVKSVLIRFLEILGWPVTFVNYDGGASTCSFAMAIGACIHVFVALVVWSSNGTLNFYSLWVTAQVLAVVFWAIGIILAAVSAYGEPMEPKLSLNLSRGNEDFLLELIAWILVYNIFAMISFGALQLPTL